MVKAAFSAKIAQKPLKSTQKMPNIGVSGVDSADFRLAWHSIFHGIGENGLAEIRPFLQKKD